MSLYGLNNVLDRLAYPRHRPPSPRPGSVTDFFAQPKSDVRREDCVHLEDVADNAAGHHPAEAEGYMGGAE
jgi:hypothetical protein